MSELAEHWIDDLNRRDGLRIEQTAEGWMIRPRADALPRTLCPCCDRHFVTQRQARSVADAMYRVEGAANGRQN